MDEPRLTTEQTESTHAPPHQPPLCEVRKGVVIPPKISRLRRKLSSKAKQEPRFRFYALYDRIYRLDVLRVAWQLVLKNDGAAGVDNVSCQDIINGPGVEPFLTALHDDLRMHRYQPQPVKRVYVAKPDGRLRPLGIPTVRDRVVQTATLLILEPIFEADFLDCSYGFRPGRNAQQAIAAIQGHLAAGYREVYDADLKGYFDTIPHPSLMAFLQHRIADRSVLKLIRLWLQSPVIEDDQDTPNGKRNSQGTPQGGVISPLLANIYLHWFEKSFHGPHGPANWASAKLVRYADDFVILARYQGARLTHWVESLLEHRFQLTINREKTKIVSLDQPGVSLDFLGYTLRYDRDLHGRGHRYLNVFPSRKALHRARTKIRELTGPKRCFVPIPDMIAEVNRWQASWARYFQIGYPRATFRALNWFTQSRLLVHLSRRSQRPFRRPEGVSLYTYLQHLGLRLL